MTIHILKIRSSGKYYNSVKHLHSIFFFSFSSPLFYILYFLGPFFCGFDPMHTLYYLLCKLNPSPHKYLFILPLCSCKWATSKPLGLQFDNGGWLSHGDKSSISKSLDRISSLYLSLCWCTKFRNSSLQGLYRAD